MMFFRQTCTIGEDGGEAAETPTRPSEPTVPHRAMVSFARCMGARRHHEVYLSAPITTGVNFVNWRKEVRSSIGHDHPDYTAQHREHVIERNIARIAPLVASLRAKFSDRLVIDPTALDDVDDWIQSDYHEFWCEVVKLYAHTVVFADGWQLSQGCVREFGTAVETRATLLTESLKPLPALAGVKMVTDAVHYLEQHGEDSTDLRRSLAKLRSTVAGGDISHD